MVGLRRAQGKHLRFGPDHGSGGLRRGRFPSAHPDRRQQMVGRRFQTHRTDQGLPEDHRRRRRPPPSPDGWPCWGSAVMDALLKHSDVLELLKYQSGNQIAENGRITRLTEVEFIEYNASFLHQGTAKTVHRSGPVPSGGIVRRPGVTCPTLRSSTAMPRAGWVIQARAGCSLPNPGMKKTPPENGSKRKGGPCRSSSVPEPWCTPK